jgi:hypothetical protein
MGLHLLPPEKPVYSFQGVGSLRAESRMLTNPVLTSVMRYFSPKTVISVLVLVIFSGCSDFDPFDSNSRRIRGDVSLYKFPENNMYYVMVDKKSVFEGTVSRLGWNSDYLIADLIKNYRGDVDGLYSLKFENLKINLIQINDLKENNSFSGIQLREAEKVYNDL